MAKKQCFKCGKTKSVDCFYAHKEMGDGYLGKCKSCAKRDVQKRYYNPISAKKIRRYERWRNQQPHRKQKRLAYQRKMRNGSPGKNRCRQWVNAAVRNGRLKRQPCEICHSLKSEAHHNDYRKPQQVRWLCFRHHREVEHGQLILTALNQKKL